MSFSRPLSGTPRFLSDSFPVSPSRSRGFVFAGTVLGVGCSSGRFRPSWNGPSVACRLEKLCPPATSLSPGNRDGWQRHKARACVQIQPLRIISRVSRDSGQLPKGIWGRGGVT